MFTLIDEAIERIGDRKESVIPLLQAIQNEYRYLPQELLKYITKQTEITPAEIEGVASFYSQFRRTPVGEHLISVCTGTACHVKGAELVLNSFRQHLGLGGHNDTDADGRFTVQKIACLGCCTLAPVVQIDHTTYGHLTPNQVGDVLDDFLSKTGPEKKGQTVSMISGSEIGEIRVGLGSCCQAQGSGRVYAELQRVVQESGQPIRVKPVGCVGMCHQTPLLETISKKGVSTFYARIQPDDVAPILYRHFSPVSWKKRIQHRLGNWLSRFWSDEFDDPTSERRIELDKDPVVSFLEPQRNLSMRQIGTMNPTDFDEYVQQGGFAAFRKVLTEMTPEQVINEVEIAGIRGRGGAGFPTSEKWKIVRSTESPQKYVICNGDEGDPGAFMDRMLLESCPFRILEGMMIAAKVVGANKGYLYIRAEYPLAVRRVNEAIAHLQEQGMLGENILGTGFSLQMTVKEGAGAFVCGEETALLESIEGKRGMPRLRPPYPVVRGLWGQPTSINNVETYSLVPWVIEHGGAEFAQLGVPNSRGTKVFALAGKIRRGGLIEVPMGITIREIVEKIGGGILNNKKFKAVQIGGPSGGCVPAELADTPVDFDSLNSVGAIMGSGGLVVLDEEDCMVDIARYFLQFTQEQSCGKCTFCRIGTKRMLEILDRLCQGRGQNSDLEELKTLAENIKVGSLCGLGKTAPNPVLSTLKYFRSEYEAHLRGECPAGKCLPLIQLSINEQCNGCSICSQICPVGAIPSTPYRQHQINPIRCVKCSSCRTNCPHHAIIVRPNSQKQ